MAKVPTLVELTDLSTKWGLVTIINEEGSILRQYKISATDADAVRASRSLTPPGCTDAEWQSGLTVLNTKCCNNGQAILNGDNSLTINYGIVEENGRVFSRVMMVPQEEWTVIDGVVHIESSVLRSMPHLRKD